MGEEDEPVVADILVQVDGALCGVGLEVGGDGPQAETGGRGAMMLVDIIGWDIQGGQLAAEGIEAPTRGWGCGGTLTERDADQPCCVRLEMYWEYVLQSTCYAEERNAT